jgi:hypothetical protein
MLFQNLKAIGEELSEICVLFCKYIYIFIYIDVPNPFSRIMAPGFAQLLTVPENVSLGKVRSTSRADNLPTNYDSIV